MPPPSRRNPNPQPLSSTYLAHISDLNGTPMPTNVPPSTPLLRTSGGHLTTTTPNHAQQPTNTSPTSPAIQTLPTHSLQPYNPFVTTHRFIRRGAERKTELVVRPQQRVRVLPSRRGAEGRENGKLRRVGRLEFSSVRRAASLTGEFGHADDGDDHGSSYADGQDPKRSGDTTLVAGASSPQVVSPGMNTTPETVVATYVRLPSADDFMAAEAAAVAAAEQRSRGVERESVVSLPVGSNADVEESEAGGDVDLEELWIEIAKEAGVEPYWT